MRKSFLAIAAALSFALSSACSFTTANISSLKLSKDREGNEVTNSFAPRDTVYAVATLSNVPGKISVKYRLIAEKVEGQSENFLVPGTEKSFDLDGSGAVTYYISAPTAGWPAGKYRIEVTMHIESGEQKDQETATFTVSGR